MLNRIGAEGPLVASQWGKQGLKRHVGVERNEARARMVVLGWAGRRHGSPGQLRARLTARTGAALRCAL
jgi:hypothetical protein